MRKEYNDRHIAPLVNPAVLWGDIESEKSNSGQGCTCNPIQVINMRGELEVKHRVYCVFGNRNIQK